MKYLKNYNTFILESLIISGKELTTLVYENIPEINRKCFNSPHESFDTIRLRRITQDERGTKICLIMFIQKSERKS